MFRTQVYLTETELDGLRSLARKLGRHQSALIRDAIDLFLKTNSKKRSKKHDTLLATKGMWSDRRDLPDLRDLRDEFDRLRS